MPKSTTRYTQPVLGLFAVIVLLTRVAGHSTYQQHSDSHHGRCSCGHSAVHQNHVVLTDVFGQPQVVQLRKPEEEEDIKMPLPRKQSEEEASRSHQKEHKLRSQEAPVAMEIKSCRQTKMTGEA